MDQERERIEPIPLTGEQQLGQSVIGGELEVGLNILAQGQELVVGQNQPSQIPATPELLDLPELITIPERDRRLQDAVRRYIEGSIPYQTFTVIRRDLYDPRRTSQSSPSDNRIATRAPSEPHQ